MRKRVFGRRLSRNTHQRKALFKNLATALITFGKITTTEAKGKAVIPFIEKAVTLAKKNRVFDRRLLLSLFPKVTALKLLDEIAPQLNDRTSGFVRIVKIGQRPSDNASMVVLEWTSVIKPVEGNKVPVRLIKSKGKDQTKPKTKTKRVAKTTTKTKTERKKRETK